MKYIVWLILSLSFIGCSGRGLENAIDNGMVALSGNKPPSFFKIANLQTMNDYVFNTKDFSFSLPSAKESDFTKMGGWYGMSIDDGNIISLGLSPFYDIELTVSTMAYTERERAIEAGDVGYLRSVIKIDNTDKLFIKKFGKERYVCTVMEYTHAQYLNKKYVGYECYKHNNNKTQSKSIHIRLTYNKPNDTRLAEEYTYEDLQKRSQRILDSLYIKDGWEE